MAQAEHLPIYRASHDLCLHLEQVVRNFSRYHKYALGADLREGARRVLKLVVRANSRRDKLPLLFDIREEVEQLKVVLRLCQDVKVKGAKRRSSGRGQGTRASSPAAAGPGARVWPSGREQEEREDRASYYWSSTTNANNPNNAWNVNFNNGNVNNNYKNNNNYVRAVRGGSWSALTSTRSASCGGSIGAAAATSGTR